MKIPRWYSWEWVVWACTGLPVQWFFTAFNGLSVFTLPDLPGPDGPSLIVWLLAIIFLYHPLLVAPLALWIGRKRNQDMIINAPNQ